MATEATGTADGEAVPPTQAKAGEASDAKSADPLKAELEVKSKEIVELKVRSHPAHLLWPALTRQDKYLRSVADFRNLQDRTKRDVQAAKNFAIQRFAKDLIDSVDNLDRALTTVPAELLQQADAKETNKDLVNLHEGLKMTETILMQTLGKHGLTRFDPSAEGEKFNPNLHEATFMAPVEGKQDGEVVQTQQKGFLLNGRVLRVSGGPVFLSELF